MDGVVQAISDRVARNEQRIQALEGRAVTMERLAALAEQREQFWADRFDRLDVHLDRQSTDLKVQITSLADKGEKRATEQSKTHEVYVEQQRKNFSKVLWSIATFVLGLLTIVGGAFVTWILKGGLANAI